MSEELEFLKLIAQRLDSAGLPYMLSGSLALNFYGEPRMTRDIDVVIELRPTDAERFAHLFQSDCYVDVEMVKEAARAHDMFNIIHNEWVIKADFIVRKASPYRVTEFARRRSVEVDGEPISVVGAEDLLLSKLVWALPSRSETQLRDVVNILRSVSDLDWAYVERWADELGVRALLDEVKP